MSTASTSNEVASSQQEDDRTLKALGKATASQKRVNACTFSGLVTELMSPKKPKPSPSSSADPKTPTMRPPIARHALKPHRGGLAVYTEAPETFPPTRVIYHTPRFVAIHDMYPKASVHLLLLPRDSTKELLHPFDALSDAAFLAEVRAEATKLRDVAAAELRRRVGRLSVTERRRNEVLDRAIGADEQDDDEGEGDGEEPDTLPPGRDYTRDILVGVHARPSMDHLHIHVLSRELHSDCLRHRKHYNSFATGFFVPLDAFPLAADDPRREPEREGFLKADFACWRCGRGFGNRFASLKDHLEEEFRAWAAE